MLGLIVLGIMALYAALVLGATYFGWRKWRWRGAGIAFVVGLLPLWDLIIGAVLLKVACATDPPKTEVYELAAAWKQRHASSLEGLALAGESRLRRYPEPADMSQWYPMRDLNRVLRVEGRTSGFGIFPPWPVTRVEMRVFDVQEGKALASEHRYWLRTLLNVLWERHVAPSPGLRCDAFLPAEQSNAGRPSYGQSVVLYIMEFER